MFRWLVENLSTLALSFFLALFIWFVAVRETNPIVEQSFRESISVRMLNQPAGTMITNTPETDIEIVLRGPRQEIEALSKDDFDAVIDLSTVPFMGAEVPVVVTVANSLISIVEQDKESIFIRLEEFRRVQIPINPQVSGSAALGYVVGRPVVDPLFVTVEGAASKVEPVARAEAKVSIDGAQQTVSETTTVRLRDEDYRLLSGINPTPLEAFVTVPITKSDEFAELFVTVDLTGTIATGYRMADFSVDPQSIFIYGRPEVVSSLPGFISTAPVDLSGADTDLTRRVGLVVPEGVTLVDAQSVVVEIDIEPVLTSLTVAWRPEILGPDPGLTATISPEVVNVGLVGPLELIASFDPEYDLDLSVNFYGLESGSYPIPVVALSNLPGVEVENVLPDTPQLVCSLF